nr:B-box zinc finger protein 22-like [Ipomoea batatas]GMD36682.1 B-box zinc finger protein 22-like [Ipomoea batatas]
MKIQCNVCEVAEANVLCCADEAALCWSCDAKVHAANKLASKHQRVPLSGSSSAMPKCDICQETVGYFFCLEDRALLCRNCDVAIHKANAYVSAHQRFLLTGVKAGLESIEAGPSPSSGNSQSGEKVLETQPRSVSRTNVPGPSNHQYNKVPPVQISGIGDLAPTKAQLGGSATVNVSQWQLEEFLALDDLDQNYCYMDNNSSKQAGSGKVGGSDCSSVLKVNEKEPDGDECLGQVPEAPWAVPQIPSPSTASGLYWPKTYRNPFDTAVFVPDVCYTPLQNPHHEQPNSTSSKRQRQY